MPSTQTDVKMTAKHKRDAAMAARTAKEAKIDALTPITISLKIPAATVGYTLMAAFDPANWMTWAWLRDVEYTGSVSPKDEAAYGSIVIYQPGFTVDLKFDDPKKPEGNGKGRKTITWADVEKGLAVMAAIKTTAHHFRDMMAEEGDAITADVLLQCIVFGEVHYG